MLPWPTGPSGASTLTNFKGCRHSSVDLSAPTILPPRVQVPNPPSMLLSFIAYHPAALGLSPKHSIYAFIIYGICAIFVV